VSSDYAAWRDRLAEAMDPRFYTIEYLDWLLATGRAFLWARGHAALVAEIRVFPTGTKAASFVVAAGDREELVNELAPQVEAWGRANGCSVALIESRPGWEKVMKGHGYSLFQASIVKEL
jgi:hypothetical protein